MTFCESMKYHCCTYEGLNKFKKLLASGVGVAIFVVALVSLINPALWANVYSQIRQMWNLLFGLLMIFMQLGWEKWIGQRFGFLNTNGRLRQIRQVKIEDLHAKCCVGTSCADEAMVVQRA